MGEIGLLLAGQWEVLSRIGPVLESIRRDISIFIALERKEDKYSEEML